MAKFSITLVLLIALTAEIFGTKVADKEKGDKDLSAAETGHPYYGYHTHHGFYYHQSQPHPHPHHPYYSGHFAHPAYHAAHGHAGYPYHPYYQPKLPAPAPIPQHEYPLAIGHSPLPYYAHHGYGQALTKKVVKGPVPAYVPHPHHQHHHYQLSYPAQ